MYQQHLLLQLLLQNQHQMLKRLIIMFLHQVNLGGIYHLRVFQEKLVLSDGTMDTMVSFGEQMLFLMVQHLIHLQILALIIMNL